MNKSIKTVESQLKKLIDEHKLTDKLSVKKIRLWVYKDNGEPRKMLNLYMMKWMKYFQNIDGAELEKAMGIFQDAWNFFPHSSLKGQSPNQMIKKIYGSEKKKRITSRKMPEVVVGGTRMSWAEYQKMLGEMKKRQRPFKKWINQEVLLNYKIFLKAKYKKRAAERDLEVSRIFFKRVLWVGFLDFERIRSEFVYYEFPEWWQTHVISPTLSEGQVRSSLKKLMEFIRLDYDREIEGFLEFN